MDAFKKLTLEFPGIRSAIDHYTSGHVINILNQLKIAIGNKDSDSLNYCLNELETWYHSNIQQISSNQFIDNFEDHVRNQKLISELKTSMLNYSFPEQELDNPTVDHSPLIFLSHSSSDKGYGDALEKFLIGLGVNNDQLIYTSHPLHKIPLDANIYEYLRNNIHRNVFMIILWSDKYLQSPACLNEMGAAWIAQSDYTNIFTPAFSFGDPKFHECAVDTKKVGAVLNGDAHCRANMIEFKNKIAKIFQISIGEPEFQYLLENFITEVKNIGIKPTE